jgi:hypothetical protein
VVRAHEYSMKHSYQHALVNTVQVSAQLPIWDELLCLYLRQRRSPRPFHYKTATSPRTLPTITPHSDRLTKHLIAHTTMSSLPFLDARPLSPAEQSASSSGSEVSRIASPSTIAQQRLLEDALQPANASQEVLAPALAPSSPTDSSGGVDVVETPVSFRGLYGHIGMISQRPTGQPSSLCSPLPGLATRSRARPTTPSPPPPPPPTADDLPGYAAHNPGPFRTLPRNLDLNDPLAGQFIRGIANMRLAMTQIDTIDTEHVRLLHREGLPHLGGGIPAAREARRALRAAEQELGEAFEAALAAVQQNRTDADRLEDLRALLLHLEGWITDSEAQTANYARRMENTVAHLRHANAQLWRENQALRAELQKKDAELQRKTVRIQYLEYEVGEYAGYN